MTGGKARRKSSGKEGKKGTQDTEKPKLGGALA